MKAPSAPSFSVDQVRVVRSSSGGVRVLGPCFPTEVTETPPDLLPRKVSWDQGEWE